jgi:serpin B
VRRRLIDDAARTPTRTLALIALAALLAACGSSTSTSQSKSTSTSSSAATSTPATTSTSTATPTPAPTSGAGLAIRSTNVLALDLLRMLGTPEQNTVFSPYSVQAALAMVYAGAAADTAAQIGKVLQAPSAAALARADSALRNRLAAAVRPQNGSAGHAQAPHLSIANGLWVQSGLRLNGPFTRTLSTGFGPALNAVDFRRQPEAARQAINAWIAARTARLIQNLMGPGSITVRTALVLANAIYLKARWSNPFVAAATAPGTFFTASAAQVKTDFMAQQQTPLSYAAGSGFRAVELPYRNSSLSMLVVMPSPGTLDGFERRLTTGSLSALAASLKPTLVNLRMPRFHLVAHTELSSTLSALGMPIAFTPRADFSGITTQTPLAISAVEHGADLKVDEAGTVAAAATGISVAPTAVAPGHVIQLSLDHPFLLFLRDDASSAILFAARVTDPTKS